MIQSLHPLLQAFLGGLFTWALTALGSACCFVIKSQNKKMLDIALGFASGVMSAASFWSLLAPGIEKAQYQMLETNVPKWVACFPIAVAFLLGNGFVWLADTLMPFLGFASDDMVSAFISNQKAPERRPSHRTADRVDYKIKHSNGVAPETDIEMGKIEHEEIRKMALSWRRVLLLIIAMVAHNIPEGLAIGVGFGATAVENMQNSTDTSVSFTNAVSLALGIGIQNFPEGMAISLPLIGFGYSKLRSFMYGQLSGIVEPIAAVAGAAIIVVANPILPYALSFAAGAMIYVVVDDIIPEAQIHGNGRLATWSTMIGFTVMMCLEVAFG